MEEFAKSEDCIRQLLWKFVLGWAFIDCEEEMDNMTSGVNVEKA